MGKIVAVILQKGGTGKSATVANLGAALARLGQKVLAVDLDPQASLTDSLGISPSDLKHSIYEVLLGRIGLADILIKAGEMTLCPSTIDLAALEGQLSQQVGREQVLSEALADVAGAYDWILLDCPPSLGLLTINALTAADLFLIPCQTNYLALRGLDHLLDTVRLVQRRTNPRLRLLGVLPTLYDARTVHHNEVLAELQKRFPGQVFEPVRMSVKFAESSVSGQPLVVSSPSNPVSKTYFDLAQRVLHAK